MDGDQINIAEPDRKGADLHRQTRAATFGKVSPFANADEVRHFRAARDAYEQAAELKGPDGWRFYAMLGEIRWRLKDGAGALAVLQEFVAHSDDPETRVHARELMQQIEREEEERNEKARREEEAKERLAREAPARERDELLGRTRWGKVLAVLLLLAVLGVVAVGFVKELRSHATPKTTPLVAPSSTPTRRPTVPIMVPSATQASRAQPNVDRARAAMADQKWSVALGFAVQALLADPTNQDAQDLKMRGERELRAQVTYETLKKKAKVKDWEQVLDAYNDLDAASVYREKAKDDYKAARTSFLQATGKAIEKLNRAHKCSESMSVAQRAGQLVPDDELELQAATGQCAGKVAVGVEPGPVDEDPPVEEPTRDNKPPLAAPSPPGVAGVEQLLAEARDALRKSQWGKTLAKASETLEISSGNTDALSLAAMASCKLNDEDAAGKYTNRIRGQQRQMMVRQFCARNAGITLP